MKRLIHIFTLLALTLSVSAQSQTDDDIDYGSMQQWKTHFAYTNIEDVQLAPDRVYALSTGALFSIDRDDDAMTYYSKLNGLSSSSIHRIDYDSHTKTLVICYDDGVIDLMDAHENIYPVTDLYTKSLNASKLVQDVAFRDGKAYMAMSFGIMVMNIRKHEISDTYYIGDHGSEVSVTAIALMGDSIYAAVEDKLYCANHNDNLMDFAYWHPRKIGSKISRMLCRDNDIYLLMDSCIYRNGKPYISDERFVSLEAWEGHIHARAASHNIAEVTPDSLHMFPELSFYWARCFKKEGNTYWIGTSTGLVHRFADGSEQKYRPNGPRSNRPYSLATSSNILWMVSGGRWAAEYQRSGELMRFNGNQWNNTSHEYICKRLGEDFWFHDFSHVAIDPADYDHIFVASYGCGLLEFTPDGAGRRYTHTNSPLTTIVPGNDHYCRVDALSYDADGNLWLTNTGNLATNIHVIDPSRKWHSFNLYQGGQRIVLNTVNKIIVDNLRPNYKWIASARVEAGIVLLNDNGTPYDPGDDRSIIRSLFVDQDGKGVSINSLHDIAQDHNGDIWLGTGEGIIVIEAGTDIFSSNACHRLKISRHDGTNLADYLLGTERINAIVFAGGNRIWIGTEASGVYLVHMVTKEGIYEPEIIAHFTTLNSPMPSDCVLSIAIDSRGEVYIGTAKGLVSYRGDATEPQETFNNAYVYPNPVRPNFEGTITITGLMDKTTVFIADAAGNVVCRTHSNGGTAIWDGKTQSGNKAHSGVYTIYCNTADGTGHTELKLLIMH